MEIAMAMGMGMAAESAWLLCAGKSRCARTATKPGSAPALRHSPRGPIQDVWLVSWPNCFRVFYVNLRQSCWIDIRSSSCGCFRFHYEWKIMQRLQRSGLAGSCIWQLHTWLAGCQLLVATPILYLYACLDRLPALRLIILLVACLLLN